MVEQEKPTKFFLTKRLALAQLFAVRNSEKSWERVDEILETPGFCDNSGVLAFATRKLKHPNGNVRDLGVSIFEKSTLPLHESVQVKLIELLDADENPYVRYRSSFALFSKGNRTDEVIRTLRDATTDPDVSEIANGYLSQLDK